MKAGYMIFNININNPDNYKEYVDKVKPIAEKYAGEYIVRGGTNKVIEGNWKYPITVVIKLPSYEKELELYESDEYKPIKKIRQENAVSNAIIIEGA